MTMKQMGEALGISQQLYSYYEKNPSLNSDLIVSVCNKFGVTADWLLGIKSKGIDERGETVLEAYYSMSEGGRARLYELAIDMASLPKYQLSRRKPLDSAATAC